MAKVPKLPRSKLLEISPDQALRGPETGPSRQTTLFRESMPDRIEPCLATLSAKMPKAAHWAYEIKWDGYRLHVHVEPSGVRIITRGGHDWTPRFPAIAAAAASLGAGTAILDGEAVVLDEQGRSDYPALLRVLGGRGGKRVAPEALFYAFDLLYLDGLDLRPGTLDERRSSLATLLDGTDQNGWIRLSEEIDGDGGALLRQACALGLEGVVAKDRRRPYRSGRGTDWLKIKYVESEASSFSATNAPPLPGQASVDCCWHAARARGWPTPEASAPDSAKQSQSHSGETSTVSGARRLPSI